MPSTVSLYPPTLLRATQTPSCETFLFKVRGLGAFLVGCTHGGGVSVGGSGSGSVIEPARKCGMGGGWGFLSLGRGPAGIGD